MMRMWAGLMLPSWSSSVPSIQGWSPGQANRTRSAISGLGFSMTWEECLMPDPPDRRFSVWWRRSPGRQGRQTRLVNLPQAYCRARRLESYPRPQPWHGRASQHWRRPEGLPGGRHHLRQPRGQGVDHHRRPGAWGQSGHCSRGPREVPENPLPQHDAHPCGARPHHVILQGAVI